MGTSLISYQGNENKVHVTKYLFRASPDNHVCQHRPGGHRGHTGGRNEYNYDNQVAQHSVSHVSPENDAHSSNNNFLDQYMEIYHM